MGKIKAKLFSNKIHKKHILHSHAAKTQHISKILKDFWYHEVKGKNENGWDPSLIVHWVTCPHGEADSKPNSTTLKEK